MICLGASTAWDQRATCFRVRLAAVTLSAYVQWAAPHNQRYCILHACMQVTMHGKLG